MQCGVRSVVRSAAVPIRAATAVASAPTALAHDPAAKPGMADLAGQFGGPVDLIDHRGRPVSDSEFRGELMLIYFGYTNGPDICRGRCARAKAR